MQYDDDALKVVRYDWQKKADEFTSAYLSLWQVPKKHRPAGKTVFLVGDSIFQGFSFNRFERLVADDPGPLAHVDRTFNFIAAASALPCRSLFSGVLGIAQLMKLCGSVATPGDMVAFLDGGPRVEDQRTVEAYFVSILGTVSSFGLEPLVFSNYTGKEADASCRYDIALGDRDTTANECIRKAASDTGARLLDLEYIGLESERKLGNVGCTLMLPDGVNYNVLGSLLIACLLVKAACGASVLTLGPVWQELQRLWPMIRKTADLPPSFPQRLPSILADIIKSR